MVSSVTKGNCIAYLQGMVNTDRTLSIPDPVYLIADERNTAAFSYAQFSRCNGDAQVVLFFFYGGRRRYRSRRPVNHRVLGCKNIASGTTDRKGFLAIALAGHGSEIGGRLGRRP